MAHDSDQSRGVELRRRESLLDQFEEQWASSAESADLKSFLNQNHEALNRELVAELIRIDLDYRLERGEPDIDDYARELGEFGSLAHKIFHSLSHRPKLSGSVEFGEKVYEIRERIGSGGMSRVFRGIDKRLNRFVAIKKIRPDLAEFDSAIERFRNEARIVAAIRDDRIVGIYDVGVQEGQLFIVFELLEGGSLAEKIEVQLPSQRVAAEMVRSIAETMHHAHRVGIIHLDLKPSNILLTKKGQLKVSDFGLARLELDDTVLADSQGPIGTASYMSPEQARGDLSKIDERADVYGMGAILYELLTGRPPFQESSTWKTLEQVCEADPVRPARIAPGVAAELEAICLKCLQKNPQDRYLSADALATDLSAFLECRPTVATPLGPAGRSWKWCKRNWTLVAIAMLALFLVATVSVVSVSRIISERNRFREQRDVAVANLYDSLAGEARAIRLARTNGFRSRAWSRIRQAINLNSSNFDPAELRNEVVAGMGDFIGQEPEVWPYQSPVLFVASSIHPDGEMIAIGRTDGKTALRQLSDRSLIQLLEGHSSSVFDVLFSTDGNRLATADETGAVQIWRREPRSGSWKLETGFRCPASARPNYVKANSLAFSKDGQSILCCPFGGTQIERWQFTENPPTSKIEYKSDVAIVRFSMSHDQRRLVIGTEPNEIIIWNRQQQEIEGKISLANERQILDVVFSPDDSLLAAGTLNGAFVFGVNSLERVLSVPGDHLITLSFSPDSQSLALPSEDLNLVRLWNIRTNRETAVLKSDAYEALFAEKSSKLVCVSATEISIWNLSDQKTRIELESHQSGVAKLFFYDNDRQLFSNDNRGQGTFHQLGNPANMTHLAEPLVIHSYLESLKLVVCSHKGQFELRRFPIQRDQPPLYQIDHQLGAQIWNAKFHPSMKCFLAAGTNGVKIWDARIESVNQDEILIEISNEQQLFSEYAGSLTATDDLQFLAWVDFTGCIHVHDLANGKPVLSRNPLQSTVPSGLAFVPKTHRLISANVEGIVTAWDVEQDRDTARVLNPPNSPGNGQWQKVHISLNGEGNLLCVQRGENIAIWNLIDSTQMVAFPPTEDLAWSIAWNQQGTKLGLGYANGEVMVWDLETINRQLTTFGLSWKP